jgi:hypothetical protein
LRHFWIIPVIVLLGAAGAWGIFHGRGQDQRWHEVSAAAVVCLVSAELALIPAMLLRRSSSVAVAQASLGGTVIHLMLTLVLAAGAWELRLVPMQRQTFIFLLLAFYWISLIGLAIALVRITRTTAASAPQPTVGRVS